MDIIFQEFVNQSYDTLSETDKKIFSQLLDEFDLDILNWILGKDAPESDEFKHIVTLIRESKNIS